MSHPTQEELISFLYDEVEPDKKNELNRHLRDCAGCRDKLSQWQQTKGELGAWKLAPAPARVVPLPVLKWAVAAGFLLLVGFGIGRWQAAPINAETLRSEIEASMQSRFEEQLTAVRNADRKQFIAMLRDVEEQRISDYTELRKDLETVAVIADQKLATTERALNQFNLIAQSGSLPQPTQ